MSSWPSGAPEEGGWGLAAEPIPLVRSVMIVEGHELPQGAGEGGPAGEVAPAELHPPVLLEDRPLQAFDEAVGPGVAWLRPGVPDPELAADLIEGPFELRPAVGEHSLDGPARAAIVRHEDLAQEGRRSR